jgi:hypothetical protein
MIMDAIFAEELQEGWLFIYMDNMLIAMDDDLQFHKRCVYRILTKLAPTQSIPKT